MSLVVVFHRWRPPPRIKQLSYWAKRDLCARVAALFGGRPIFPLKERLSTLTEAWYVELWVR